jgi:hypothetical protein
MRLAALHVTKMLIEYRDRIATKIIGHRPELLGSHRHRRCCQLRRFSFLRIPAITWQCARLASMPLARL